MTIAKDFASKFSVAFVAIAMLFTLVAPAVNAQESTEDLQKTITDLLAQVAELQAKMGGTTTTTTTTTTTSCDVPMAPLTMGSQGAGVTTLQNILISAGYSIPAGATGYFGAQTRSALAAWQAASNISPAAGYYGPISKAALEANCAPADDEDEDEDDSDDSSSDELSGEGELSTFEIDNASDTDVQEGAEDVEIAELTLEAEDGDIEIARMNFTLTTDGDVAQENDPWDVFETISVWVDGDMVAEFDASDEDEYLNEDEGTFRISGLDLVLMEDEEVDVIIGATVMSSVDQAGVADRDDWTIAVDEIRYFDADGVATDEDGTVDFEFGDTASFNIVEAGDGEELKFGLGDNNPDSTDIVVEEDDTTDGVTIMEYTIEAEEGDIELNTLFANIEITGDVYADVVDDIMLVIDGEEFDDEEVVTSGDYTTSDVRVEFDIDGDVVIDMDEEVTVEVVVDFKAQDPNGPSTLGENYLNGTKIEASVNSAETDITDAEGMDDVEDFSGTAVGDEHTLVATGIVLPVDGVETMADASGDNDTTGEFEITFEVTAVEGDFYINDLAGASTTIGATLGGVGFSVQPSGAGVATGVSGSLTSTADEGTNGAYRVSEGETEEFTLNVTFTASTAGQFRVVLDEVWYSDEDDGEDATPYIPTPASDFRTSFKQVNVTS